MGRVGDLEIDQDLEFQEREWRVERVGWALLAGVVVLAAFGVFGHGPVSWTKVSSGDGSLEVSFERFGRRGGSQALVVSAPASEARRGVWDVEISRSYVDAMDIDAVTPEAEAVEAVDGAVRYSFSQGSPDADLDARLSLTPRAMGPRRGEVRVSGGEPVGVHHFLFP